MRSFIWLCSILIFAAIHSLVPFFSSTLGVILLLSAVCALANYLCAKCDTRQQTKSPSGIFPAISIICCMIVVALTYFLPPTASAPLDTATVLAAVPASTTSTVKPAVAIAASTAKPTYIPTATPKPITYIANKSTKKFHRSTCYSVDRMKEGNKVTYSNRQDAIDDGYDPCGNCFP